MSLAVSDRELGQTGQTWSNLEHARLTPRPRVIRPLHSNTWLLQPVSCSRLRKTAQLLVPMGLCLHLSIRS
jgi:hypothetical protein